MLLQCGQNHGEKSFGKKSNFQCVFDVRGVDVEQSYGRNVSGFEPNGCRHSGVTWWIVSIYIFVLPQRLVEHDSLLPRPREEAKVSEKNSVNKHRHWMLKYSAMLI